MNTDLNSPLSFAIISVIFIEFWGITGLGLFKYGSKFINFSSPINFFVGFLELIAEFARIISFTFRLFGNMLAGEILLLVMTFLMPFLIALPFYGLETFVGMIQAFVFFMLTVAFGALACAEHGEHDGEAEGEHGLVSAEYGSDSVIAPSDMPAPAH
jgi:F-type H+-transporting ATPase subunit a